jgi:type IV fimbrial biogenesis protein FimT
MTFQKTLSHLQLGQSFLETLFVLFLLALMCGMAASSMRFMQTKIQIQTAAQDMLNAVLKARTEALRLERRVTLCVAESTSDLPKQCVLPSGYSSLSMPSWQQGWLMFVDDNSNGIWDPEELLLQQSKALPSVVSATGNATVNRYISFGANGRSLVLNGGFQAGTLTFCERLSASNPGWLLIINAVGRPRLEKTQIANCL